MLFEGVCSSVHFELGRAKGLINLSYALLFCRSFSFWSARSSLNLLNGSWGWMSSVKLLLLSVSCLLTVRWNFHLVHTVVDIWNSRGRHFLDFSWFARFCSRILLSMTLDFVLIGRKVVNRSGNFFIWANSAAHYWTSQRLLFFAGRTTLSSQIVIASIFSKVGLSH